MEIFDIVWRRLDYDGMEACRFRQIEQGWELNGTAIAVENGVVSNLSYQVIHDANWNAQSAHVNGFVGSKQLDLHVRHTAEDGWSGNDKTIPGLAKAADIDLGFTPATNTSAIRRLALETGESRNLVAVWLDPYDWTFKPLAQKYLRKSNSVYEYVSVRSGYHCDLNVDAAGLITLYPELWTAVGTDPAQPRS